MYLGAGSTNNSFVTGNNSDLLIGGGWNDGLGTSRNLNAKVAEIIVYTSIPTPLEQERIQSYLAIKYGITKNSADNATTPEDEADYFASDGTTVVWDHSLNTTYHNKVTGIGRDDDTGLEQRKSKNNNNETVVVTIDKTTPFTNDKEFIIWGNNTATGTSTAITGYPARTARIWKVAVTGTPGTVSFSIDLEGTEFDLLNSTAADFALVIDTDEDFTTGAVPHTTGAVLDKGVLSFTNVNFTDGDFFVIAGPLVNEAPGNVTTNLKLWLKADAGVTGTGPVTAWANQTGTTEDAIQIADAPDLLTDQVNFNPAIDFNGTNDYLQITGGILGTRYYNDLWVYSVTKADVLNTGTVLRETTNSGQFAVLNPWGANTYIFTNSGNYNIASGANTSEYNIWTHASSTLTSTPSGTRKSIARDGMYLGAGSTNNSFVTGNNSDLLIGGGWNDGLGTSRNLNAKVAEIIVYTSIPTPLEQERIQSYLAIKYGITKNSVDNATTPEDEADYFASDGTTVVWDHSLSTTYHNDVTGIGRDDDTALVQQRSKSINTTAITTMDKGGAFTNDKDFIVWGNNAATGIRPYVGSGSYIDYTNKVWKVATTGSPGNVTVSIDISSLGFDLTNSAAQDFALLIDTDEDFTAGVIEHTTGVTLTAGILSFTMVDFTINNTTFFTLAKAVSKVSVITNRNITHRVNKN